MNKLKPLHTFKGSVGVKASTEQMTPFYNAIKSVCEKLSVSHTDVQGIVRVYAETSDHLATKNWELSIVCPPLPKNHRLHSQLEAVIETAAHDKRVKSWGYSCNPTQF